MEKNLLQMSHGFKAFASKVLFDDATFAVNQGEHIGVIGPNGAGKSTLFKTIMDEERLDGGQLIKSRGLRIGILRQESHFKSETTVKTFLEETSPAPIWEIEKLAEDFQILESDFNRPLGDLSGGYQMRVRLIGLIAAEPDLLLLDEPTNYLDLDTLILLEGFLSGYEGTFMVISHDRVFLKKVTDHILEVENGEVTKFNGNLDDYFEQKAQLQEILQREAKNAEAKKKRIEAFVNKFRAKATKARQAQSKLKILEKMEDIEVPTLTTSVSIHLPEPHRTGKDILQIENGKMGYPDKTVLKDVNFQLQRGDHLGIVGQNGTGKSTFLKSLAGELDLKDGSLKVGHNVSIGYYAQHVSQALSPRDTVLSALMGVASEDVSEQDVKTLAGSLLFSGSEVEKPIRILSGGEKSRVALGQILLKRSPCLLLDEPTNHLDFDTVEALAEALKTYSGTVVVVSHDRAFIKKVTTKILEVKNGEAHFYPGTYDEYVWSLQKGALARDNQFTDSQVSEGPGEKVEKAGPPKNYKKEKKRLESEVRNLKKLMSDIEEKQRALETEMTSLNKQLLDATGENSEKFMKELSHLQEKNEQLEKEYFATMESLESSQESLEHLTNS